MQSRTTKNSQKPLAATRSATGMGQLRFLVHAPDQVVEKLLPQTYLSGMDRTPWLVRCRLEGNLLIVERDVSESASAQVLWSVEPYGLLMLSTGTLVERPTPYLLPLELARGTINQLRHQLFEWQSIGLVTPPAVKQKLLEVTQHFARAAVRQDRPLEAVAWCQECACAALDVSQWLANTYAEQAIAGRRHGAGSSRRCWADRSKTRCPIPRRPSTSSRPSTRRSCPSAGARCRPASGRSLGTPPTRRLRGAAPTD